MYIVLIVLGLYLQIITFWKIVISIIINHHHQNL